MIKKKRLNKVSIVIATVGEDSLNLLIEDLYSGSVIPSEVILVYPPNVVSLKRQSSFKNLSIMNSNKKGQVAQRYLGIEKAKYDIILQLDADIRLKKDTIEKLMESYFRRGPRIAIGANVKIINQEIKVSNFTKYSKFFFNFLGGGDINIVDESNKFRFDCWFNNYSQPKKSQYVNLIPGGCTLFNKNFYKNLDYYPFTGHAIGEDIINSIHLRNYGNKLFFEHAAEIFQPISSGYEHHSVKDVYFFLVKLYKIKKFICNIANGSIYRYHIWFMYFVIVSLTKFLVLGVKNDCKIK